MTARERVRSGAADVREPAWSRPWRHLANGDPNRSGVRVWSARGASAAIRCGLALVRVALRRVRTPREPHHAGDPSSTRRWKRPHTAAHRPDTAAHLEVAVSAAPTLATFCASTLPQHPRRDFIVTSASCASGGVRTVRRIVDGPTEADHGALEPIVPGMRAGDEARTRPRVSGIGPTRTRGRRWVSSATLPTP